MDSKPIVPAGKDQSWKQSQVIVLCGICLIVGLFVGYLVRGSERQPAPVAEASQPVAAEPAPSSQAPPQMSQMPSLDDMKRMADKQVQPLLAQLKSDPHNPKLLNQIGLAYKTAHQFPEAAKYFEESLQADPRNIPVRADYSSCLYFNGDVDGALAQLDKALTYDPKHTGILINIGIIKLKGKNDPDGAVAAWEKILKYHPDLPQKDKIEQMIAQARESKKAAAVAHKG